MADKHIDEVLRDAGLDDESIHLIADNKLIAEAVASSAKKICNKFRAVIADLPSHRITKYKSKWDPPRILKAIAAIQQRGENVTQTAVSKELRCHQTSLSRLLTRHPEIKEAYLTARNGS